MKPVSEALSEPLSNSASALASDLKSDANSNYSSKHRIKDRTRNRTPNRTPHRTHQLSTSDGRPACCRGGGGARGARGARGGGKSVGSRSPRIGRQAEGKAGHWEWEGHSKKYLWGEGRGLALPENLETWAQAKIRPRVHSLTVPSNGPTWADVDGQAQGKTH